jgi:hypothetical protein
MDWIGVWLLLVLIVDALVEIGILLSCGGEIFQLKGGFERPFISFPGRTTSIPLLSSAPCFQPLTGEP